MHLESNNGFFDDPAPTPRPVSPLRVLKPSAPFPSSSGGRSASDYAESHNASSLSDLPVSDTSSPPPRKVVSKKRKLEENSEDLAAVTSESATLPVEWEATHRLYSRRKIKNRHGKSPLKSEYRCTPCFEVGKLHLCTREGDIVRHLSTRKHSPKSYFCLDCPSAFTRNDALKRHKNKCTASAPPV
jgi:hypothetical protein